MYRQQHITIFILLFFALFSLPTAAYSFDKDVADSRWAAVRDTGEEATFLIHLFLTERMPGEYPHKVRKRFREIASRSDALYLLDRLLGPAQKKEHAFAYTLLKEVADQDLSELFEEYFYRTADQDIQNKLFNLMTRKNSLRAFRNARGCINQLFQQGRDDEAIAYLDYIVRFDHPDIRSELITDASSASNIVRAVSYVALRNYPDMEVRSIIDNALSSEFSSAADEAIGNSPSRKRGQQSIDDILREILKTGKRELEKSWLDQNDRKIRRERSEEDSPQQAEAVTAYASDLELAAQYAPHLLLSGPGIIGVDIREDPDYPYTDYIPIDVNNVTTNPEKKININLATAVLYNETTYGPGDVPLGDGALDIIGDAVFRSSANYLDFSPLWDGLFTTVSSGYKTLSLDPTVYFKVFRNASKENSIAVQYWFFYYYNDWLNDHPGDWETITIFLNGSGEPAEVAFSTHYEASRYSWANIELDNATHAKVYISNGGHGSYYQSGNTSYFDTPLGNINDNHMGDKEVLSYVGADYTLIDLQELESTDENWIWFEGRWGDEDSASQGPHLRTDAPTANDWGLANNPPYDPYNMCEPRYQAHIYGDAMNNGPWYWGAGYGLDTPWDSADDCEPIVDSVESAFSWNLFLPALLGATLSAARAR